MAVTIGRGQKHDLPNFYSRWICLGNCMCFCIRKRNSRGVDLKIHNRRTNLNILQFIYVVLSSLVATRSRGKAQDLLHKHASCTNETEENHDHSATKPLVLRWLSTQHCCTPPKPPSPETQISLVFVSHKFHPKQKRFPKWAKAEHKIAPQTAVQQYEKCALFLPKDNTNFVS